MALEQMGAQPALWRNGIKKPWNAGIRSAPQGSVNAFAPFRDSWSLLSFMPIAAVSDRAKCASPSSVQRTLRLQRTLRRWYCARPSDYSATRARDPFEVVRTDSALVVDPDVGWSDD
jgi:hypothetical protein